jgi:TPR repeat protein
MFGKKSKNKNTEKNVETKIPSSNSDNESVETLSLENETLSLDNESFISFKTKTNSTVDISIKSLTKSFAKLSINLQRKGEQLISSIKEKLKKVSPKFSDDFKKFISKQKDEKLEDNFLGYYECIIPNNMELSIPKFYLSTARIDLHEEKSVNSEKAKRLVLTKIKENPFNPTNNIITSLFIITGKHEQNSTGTGWTGIKYNKLPKWIIDDSIKDLGNCTPIKGLGTYNVFIDKIGDKNIFKDVDIKKLEENAKNEDGFIYKMMLAGYYMIGVKENYSNSMKLIPEAEKWYKEAVKWCKEAEKSGSLEAKLCLGYMYSIGFSIIHYDPQKAKKCFKEVIDAIEITETTDKEKPKENAATEKKATKETTTDKNTTEEDKNVSILNNEVTENASKELVRVAMRNVAILYHNSYVIKPFEWKNFVKITKLNDLTFKQLTKQKLKLAIKWYEKSCELRDSQSAYNLGLLYESNQVIKDEKKAENWFEMAVQFDENNLYAKAKLGRILINKVDENEKMRGIEMLKYAAENGSVMGQTFLGEMYEKERNTKEAKKFYFMAAKQNRGYYSHVAQIRLRDFRASDIISAGENDIENIIGLFVKEFEYYYNNNEEKLKNIH